VIEFIIIIITAVGIAVGTSINSGSGGGSVKDTGVKSSYQTALEDPKNKLYYETQEYKNQWGLSQIQAAEAYAFLANNGKKVAGDGVTIGITDELVLTTHQEFNGAEKITGGTSTTSESGHGTHVAGIAAGEKDDLGMHGVAFNAKINSVGMNFGSIVTTANAGSKVINASWGVGNTKVDGGKTIRKTDDEIKNGVSGEYGTISLNTGFQNIVSTLANTDSLVIFAAGNDYDFNTAQISQGTNQQAKDSYAPTSVDQNNTDDNLNDGYYNLHVIATNKSGGIAYYSNRCGVAKNACISAPGGAMFSENDVGGIYSSVATGTSSYENKQGTSMAAPLVTGAAAVLRAAWTNLTAPQAAEILLKSAVDLGEKGTDDVYGVGMLNLYKAVQANGNASFSFSTLSSSKSYSLASSAISSSEIFGDSISKNLSPNLSKAIFLDDYGRDYKVNLASNISYQRRNIIDSSSITSFNNYQHKTLDLINSEHHLTKLQFYTNSYKNNSAKNPFGLKFLTIDNSREDARIVGESGLYFAHDFSQNSKFTKGLKLGFAVNKDKSDDLNKDRLSNFISIQNTGSSPFQHFVSNKLSNNSSKFTFNQNIQEKKIFEKFRLGFSNQTSYDKYNVRDNQMSDFSLFYKASEKTDLSFSFGNLNEFNNNFLNSKMVGAFESLGVTKTSYFKVSLSKELKKNLYLIGAVSEGNTQARGNDIGVFRKFSNIRSSSQLIGLVSESFFKGRAGIIYSRPLSVYSGKALIDIPVGLDNGGNIVRFQDEISLKARAKETDVEVFYSRGLTENSSINLNLVSQRNPSNIKSNQVNYVGIIGFGLQF
jgi:subtilisin family serine protease